MMTKTTFKRICVEKLKEVAPEAYRECERLMQPKLADFKAIPSIIKYVESQGYENNSVNGSMFIGTIYAILTPYKLFYPNIRIPIGLRDIIAKEMCFVNSEMINYHANILPTYTRGNGKWLVKINELANGYLSNNQ